MDRERSGSEAGRNRLGKFLYPGIYNEGTGEIPPMPEKGAKLFFFLWGTYFLKLIALNFVTLLLCIPIVTIPASLTALSRVLMKLTLQGYCSVYQEYFDEWKSALLRYLPFFLISAAPAAGGIAFVYSRIATLSGIGGFALVSLCAIAFLVVYLLWCYAFPLFAMIDLPVLQNVKNAFFFVFTQRKANFLLLLPIIAVGLCIAFLPWTLPLFFVFLFSIPALIICCIVKPLMMQYIIQPYQEKSEGASAQSAYEARPAN